ncbi:MAG: hypothetical protein M3O50_13270 [Myxococcota bacterium]|nr:hypothetical protein [Myxococcota bacterium]
MGFPQARGYAVLTGHHHCDAQVQLRVPRAIVQTQSCGLPAADVPEQGGAQAVVQGILSTTPAAQLMTAPVGAW